MDLSPDAVSLCCSVECDNRPPPRPSPPPCQREFMAQMAKNLPAMREIRLGALGQEDPLEEGMATHSSILAWRIPWTEELLH